MVTLSISTYIYAQLLPSTQQCYEKNPAKHRVMEKDVKSMIEITGFTFAKNIQVNGYQHAKNNYKKCLSRRSLLRLHYNESTKSK